MTDAPAIKPYIVTLVFRDGPITTRTIFAPGPSEASALVAIQIVREIDPPEELAGLVVFELQADWLRTALRAAEGKLPASGEAHVLSLVPQQAAASKPPEVSPPHYHPAEENSSPVRPSAIQPRGDGLGYQHEP